MLYKMVDGVAHYGMAEKSDTEIENRPGYSGLMAYILVTDCRSQVPRYIEVPSDRLYPGR